MSKRVYLAGPDVFFPEPKVRAEKLKETCRQYGLEGIFPLDAEIKFDVDEPGPSKAMKIFGANTALIDSCDGVIANMTPFRGPSADVGTAWEMGYAFAKRKLVIAYSNWPVVYRARVKMDGMQVEDFGLVDNLMLTCSANVYDAFDTAALWMSERL